MRLFDFVDKDKHVVTQMISDASEAERLELLRDLVMRNRPTRGHRIVCPYCETGHRREVPKIVDTRNRVWHFTCVQKILAERMQNHAGIIEIDFE